jgi:hypothetical protein
MPVSEFAQHWQMQQQQQQSAMFCWWQMWMASMYGSNMPGYCSDSGPDSASMGQMQQQMMGQMGSGPPPGMYGSPPNGMMMPGGPGGFRDLKSPFPMCRHICQLFSAIAPAAYVTYIICCSSLDPASPAAGQLTTHTMTHRLHAKYHAFIF